MIVRVNIVLNRTVLVESDWRFDNLWDSHLHSESELYHVSWWYLIILWLLTWLVNYVVMVLCTYQRNAGGAGGRAWGGDLTFFKNLQSNSLPTGKSFQSNATKSPWPGLHIAVNPKAEPKKGTIKISPNKTLQSFINVPASPKIHVPVTVAIIRFNHNPCYTA